MKLSLLERFIVLGLLPQESDFRTMGLVIEAKRVLAPTQDEITRLNIRIEDYMTKWDDKAEAEYGEQDINLAPTLLGMIGEALIKMDRDKKLTEQHVSLYSKFYNPPAIVELVK